MSSSAPSVTNAWMLLHLDVTTVERHRHAQEQLRAFEEHGGPETIPALAQRWGQQSWPDELRHCASAALAGIIGRAPVQALPRVDEAIRERESAWSAVRWDDIRPAEIPALVSDDPHPVTMLGLLGCHHRGHVREAAVRALAQRREGLPWLLLRVNDWVAPIRIRASTAVSEPRRRQGPCATASLAIPCLP